MDKTEKLHVARIRIDNILGIDHLEIEPGAVTVLEGANGSGKTSALRAIRSAIGGGHDVTMIREGAEAGEVVILLEDGTVIRNRTTDKSSRLTVKDPGGNTIKGPQRFLNALRDVLSLNPIDFVEAKPAERLRMLAAVVPRGYDRAEIEAAAGIPLPNHVELTGGALEILGRAEEVYYDQRREANVQLRQATETVEGLRPSLLDVDGAAEEQAKSDLESLRASREEARLNRAESCATAEATCADTIARSNGERQRIAFAAGQRRGDRLAEAKAAFDAAKAEAEAEHDAVVSKADAALAEAREAAHAVAAQVKAEAERECGEIVASIESGIGELEERLRGLQQASGARAVFEKQSALAESLAAKHERLEEAVAAVRGLRDSLLADLPIKGLEVRGGDVWHGGVPWPNLEESRRVWIAVQVATLRAGKIGLLCVDGLERLDEERFKLFAREVTESGAQLIGARVGTDGLKVTYPGLD